MSIRARITEADLTRVLKAARKAGFKTVRVVIDPAGNLTIEASETTERLPEPDDWV